MYKATVLDVVENPNSPDQISVTVEYTDGEKTFKRQYDWLTCSVNENTIELTVQDELTKMNIDTKSIIDILKPKIGMEISLSISPEKTVSFEVKTATEIVKEEIL